MSCDLAKQFAWKICLISVKPDQIMLRVTPREVESYKKIKKEFMERKHQLRCKRKWEKLNLKISKQLRDIIHGYIMSDGYVNQKGILTIDQGKKQKKFVEWLASEFNTIKASNIKQQIRIHSKTQRKTISFRFSTKAVLHGFHAMWYKPYLNKHGLIRYKKKLPKSCGCFLNSKSVSIWFAGDGTKVLGSVGAKFEITSFSVKERLLLQKIFLTKFGIKTMIIKSGKTKKGNEQWALKIPSKSYGRFYNLITQNMLIPDVFPYKLHKKSSFLTP